MEKSSHIVRKTFFSVGNGGWHIDTLQYDRNKYSNDRPAGSAVPLSA